MDDNFDGGPAFPEPGLTGLPNGEFIHGRPGMSKREAFAMHVLPQVIRQCAADARESDEDHATMFARRSVELADALLRALAAPRPEPEPKWPEFNVYTASMDQCEALKTLRTRTWFEQLPQAIRTYVTDAVAEITRVESTDDDVPF